MCGIAGYVTRHDPASREIVDKQLQLLLHRGPDSAGSVGHGRGVVGQTRLRIIDLDTGDPPIATPNGSVGVAFNGEIYNYRELRAELAARGHTFRTSGDTEVIAHLAEELTPVALARRLDGMFAFAVWDRERERLIVGRDRLGKKPLYWWHGDASIVFASEIKALVAHPDVPRRLDEDAIPAYLTFGYVPTPRTFYAGVRSLPPGHVLVVDRDFHVTVEPYWEAPITRPGGAVRLDVGLDEAARLVRQELAAAVRRRLVADVPLGAFLSGGIDSSAIVGLMAAESTEPVRTFTIGFEDRDGFDERPYAATVARRFGTDHTEFVVQPHAVDLIESLTWHHDQPFGDSSAIPTYLLAELTRAHVTVSLSGDGGDELFGGYERFGAGLVADRWRHVPSALRSAASAAVARAPHDKRLVARTARFLATADRGLPDAFRTWISYVPEHVVSDLVPAGSTWALDDYRRIWDESEGAAVLDRLLLLNLRTYLVDDLLPKADRMSMAHGLEVRSPFLDHRLVELALRLPPSTKVRGMSLKRCLKRAVADLLPAEILDRPKRGFGVPLARWFREDLSLLLDATLADPAAGVRRHLAPEAIDRLLADHRSGRADHGHALWTLLTLETFLRRQGW